MSLTDLVPIVQFFVVVAQGFLADLLVATFDAWISSLEGHDM